MENLTILVRRAAEARQCAARAKAGVNELLSRFKAEHSEEFETELELQNAATVAERDLREAALATYIVDGDKRPVPGVAIRELRSYLYDPLSAIEWAKEHGICLIPEQLDRKAFEGLCATASRPEWVEEHVTPQATIASDLTAALAELDAAQEAAA